MTDIAQLMDWSPKRKPKVPRGRNQPRTIEVDGSPVLVCGIGHAADAWNLSKKTIRAYEDAEVIPLNRVIDKLGRRWYPVAFVALLKPVLENQRTKRLPRWKLKDWVERVWKLALEQGTVSVLKEEA